MVVAASRVTVVRLSPSSKGTMSHRAGLARHVCETPGRDPTDPLGGSAEGDGVKWKLLLACSTS